MDFQQQALAVILWLSLDWSWPERTCMTTVRLWRGLSQCGYPPCFISPLAWRYLTEFEITMVCVLKGVPSCRSLGAFLGRDSDYCLLWAYWLAGRDGAVLLHSEWLTMYFSRLSWGWLSLWPPYLREILGQKEPFFEFCPVVLAISQQQNREHLTQVVGWTWMGEHGHFLRQIQESRRTYRPQLQECFKFTFEIGWGMLWKLCWSIGGISKCL